MAGRRDSEPPFFRPKEVRRQEEHAAAAPRPELQQPQELAPQTDGEKDRDWLFARAEKRLAAANTAIGTTRAFFFALLSVVAYIGVVIASTTDEQLLRISPIKLPIIGVEVPLTGFYFVVPWLFVLLHFNLLIHLGLTSRKLKTFLDDIEPLDPGLSRRLRNDVANFPPAQWMTGSNDVVFRIVLAIVVWIMLVLIPPFLLLWMELRFLAFQDSTFTWLQTAALGLDALLIIGFRAWFVRQIQPKTRWLVGWKELWRHRGMSFALWMRLLLTQPLFRYLLLLVPLGLAMHLSVEQSNLLASDDVPNCKQWLCSRYRLDLQEKLLTRNTPAPAVVNALRGIDSEAQRNAMNEILGLDLRNRHLRGANLVKAQLQDANLTRAKLQGADLQKAHLQEADLSEAQIQRAILHETQLHGANLSHALLLIGM